MSVQTNSEQSDSRWWITTGPLTDRGEKVLGPFVSQELALQVRTYVEKVERHQRYWVDEDTRS